MEQRQGIIERVKKCLALGRSDNANEAAAALQHAQALMQKYGIAEEDVRLSDVQSKTARIGKTLTLPRHIVTLISIIESAFGCKAVVSAVWDPRWTRIVKFIGIDPYPEIASYTFDVLRRRLVRDRKRYISTLSKRLKRSTKTRRADIWAEGWVTAVALKARKLAIGQDKEELVEAWLERNCGELENEEGRRHKRFDRWDRAARWRGYDDGENVDLHHGVSGRDRSLIGG